MSVQPTQQPPQAYGGYDSYDDPDRGYGWVVFAGILLLIVGTINIIEGIAAIGGAHFFTRSGVHYVFGSLKSWGWIVLIIGAAQVLVGLGIFAKNQFTRWIGIVVLMANALAQVLMMPAYPFWSLSLLALDVIAIFGLALYGDRIVPSDRSLSAAEAIGPTQ
jgi:hypothetical protein